MALHKKYHESILKERFIILHDYAHLMFLTIEGIKQCDNEGVYSSSTEECLKCDIKHECEYLSGKSHESMMNDDLKDTTHEMEVAKNFIKCHAKHNEQIDGTCHCDSCSWLYEYTRTQLEAFDLMKVKLIEVTS